MLEMAGNPPQRAVSASELGSSLSSMMAKVVSIVEKVVDHKSLVRHASQTLLPSMYAYILQHLMIVKMLAMVDVIVIQLHPFVRALMLDELDK